MTNNENAASVLARILGLGHPSEIESYTIRGTRAGLHVEIVRNVWADRMPGLEHSLEGYEITLTEKTAEELEAAQRRRIAAAEGREIEEDPNNGEK